MRCSLALERNEPQRNPVSAAKAPGRCVLSFRRYFIPLRGSAARFSVREDDNAEAALASHSRLNHARVLSLFASASLRELLPLVGLRRQ
jgi:hypothetical protein